MTRLQHSPLWYSLAPLQSSLPSTLGFRPGILCVLVLYLHSQVSLYCKALASSLTAGQQCPCPAATPAGGCAGRGTASGCTHSARGSDLFCTLLGQTLSWVAGIFFGFCVQEFPSPLQVAWHQWGCPEGYPAASAPLPFPSQLCSSLAAAGPSVSPEQGSWGVPAQLREQSSSPQEREGSALPGKDATLSERTRYLIPGKCLQQGVSSQGGQDLQPGCLLSIVWQVVCACHISSCLQWHFPALSCHGANVGAVTTGTESLFVQGHTQGGSCLLPHPEPLTGPRCAPSRTQLAQGRRSREGPAIAKWGLESWDS